MGGAYNLNKQMFTAPKYGVYRFLFKGKILFPSADQSKFSVEVQLRVNDISRQIMDNHCGADGNVMFEKLLKLHNGEKVNIVPILKSNSNNYMSRPSPLQSTTHNSYFIGSLLEELEL